MISLVPILLSLLILPKAKQRWQNNLTRARNQSQRRYQPLNRSSIPRSNPFIGDITCIHNARSPYLRCAINPQGPCQNCTDYRQEI